MITNNAGSGRCNGRESGGGGCSRDANDNIRNSDGHGCGGGHKNRREWARVTVSFVVVVPFVSGELRWATTEWAE